MNPSLENQLLLAFYGDDFTGSTDVLESLARAGLQAALFLKPPSPEQIEGRGLHAVGVAGISRSLPAEQMDAELRPVFEALHKLKPRFAHYKVCSTFDSSPHIGSIGRALEIGQSTFGSPYVLMVVGAPILGRYCVFGNLFARSGGESEPFRLDRHPTMRRHPTTPMTESDLRLHLSQQTDKSIALLDVLKLDLPAEQAADELGQLFAESEIVIFDTLYNEHLTVIGQLMCGASIYNRTLFCVGSSGVEYALTSYWKAIGSLPDEPHFRTGKVEQIVAVSGSCSSVTASQVEWAVAHGWGEIALQTEMLVNAAKCENEIKRIVHEATKVLSSGRSVVLHTCRGPQDERLPATAKALRNRPDGAGSAEVLGTIMGHILRAILQATHLTRVAVTGGDTSGFVARALAIESLEFVSTLYPGSPLCRARSADAAIENVEIVFKGGQVGKVDFLECVRRGHI